MFYLLSKSHSCKSKILKKALSLKCLICCRMKSYYAVLGLNSAASAKEIKSAYYKLSLQHHPDKNDGSPESVAKFREITEAYEVLGNPEKRKKYDQQTVFHSQYSGSHSYNGYYKPRNTRGPYTGKTKEYDYDEHFKQHYEEMNKRRQAEYEYFKKRWESEFYRRYPHFENYYRRRPGEDEEYNREAFKRHFAARKQAMIFVFSFWSVILFLQIFKELFNPDFSRHKTIYYGSAKDEENEGE